MKKLLWIGLLGLALAGCSTDANVRSTSSSGGSSAPGSAATTAQPGANEDMRNSKQAGPGPEGDRQRPAAGSTAPRSTY